MKFTFLLRPDREMITMIVLLRVDDRLLHGQVAFEIDQEVRKIVNGCHDEAKKLIQAHETELTRIAEALMEYETLTAEQIQKVVKGEDISADFTDTKSETADEQPSTDEMNA